MADAPDALSQAQTQINAQKTATLAAIAKGGQQAADAYTAAQSGNTASRTAALQAQLGSLGNAPVQFSAGQQAQLAAPYNNAQANLTQMGQARQDFLGNLGASSGNYFDQANAAIPAMRAAAHSALLNSNTKLAQAAITANTNLQLKQLEIQAAEAKLNPATQTTADTLKGLGSTAAEQGANIEGIGQQRNQANIAATQAQAAGVTYNPMGLGYASSEDAYPTVGTPGPVQSSAMPVPAINTPAGPPGSGIGGNQAGAPGGGVDNPFTYEPGLPGTYATAASQAAQVQELNRRLAALGATGAPGYIAGETVNPVTGYSGGIPNISPALAGQLYDASSGGKADAAAITAANSAATKAAQPLPNTTANVKASGQYQAAFNEFTLRMKASGATPQKVFAAMLAPHKVQTPNGDGPEVTYDMPVISQVMSDLAAQATQAATITAAG